jgi:hypothetical protein
MESLIYVYDIHIQLHVAGVETTQSRLVAHISGNCVWMSIGPFLLSRLVNQVWGLVLRHSKQIKHCWFVDIWKYRDRSFELLEG